MSDILCCFYRRSGYQELPGGQPAPAPAPSAAVPPTSPLAVVTQQPTNPPGNQATSHSSSSFGSSDSDCCL